EICEGPLRDVDGAIEARRQLVLLDPSDDEAADHLEQILQKAEKWDELAELLLRRAEVDADEEMRVERALRAAVIHRDQRRDNLAAGNAYAWVAELNPTDSENANLAVDLFLSDQRLDRATQFLQLLLSTDVGGAARSGYSRRFGEILEQNGQILEAGGAYAEAGAAV